MIPHLLKSIDSLSYYLKMKTIEHFFSKYYVPNVQIEDFNVLIDGKSFFDMPIKNDEETYEQIIGIGRNNY